jgi:hypothetical protein
MTNRSANRPLIAVNQLIAKESTDLESITIDRGGQKDRGIVELRTLRIFATTKSFKLSRVTLLYLATLKSMIQGCT